MKLKIQELAWEKMNGLLPVLVQDAETGEVLMQAYMNQEALENTLENKVLTFFSRSKNRLWTKGETSGNRLELVDIFPDCDKDALLIHAHPTGPICHTGEKSCFGEKSNFNFIESLENIIQHRAEFESENSYTRKLLNSGISRIAQKVGEEGVEVALGAIEKNDKDLCGEAADLFFHLLVLLKARNLKFKDVVEVLKERSRS